MSDSLCPDDGSDGLYDPSDDPEERPERTAVLEQAEKLLRSFRVKEALRLLDEAGVDLPQESLLLFAETAWGGRRYNSDPFGADAIQLFTRAGAVARLNRIGEHLALDVAVPEALDAFYGAGNLQRVREVGEEFLRNGEDAGLYMFTLLKIPRLEREALLKEYARAVLARTGLVHTMLRELKAARIRLPRTLLVEAAKRYRRNPNPLLVDPHAAKEIMGLAEDRSPKKKQK